jgi:hypothetical protein
MSAPRLSRLVATLALLVGILAGCGKRDREQVSEAAPDPAPTPAPVKPSPPTAPAPVTPKPPEPKPPEPKPKPKDEGPKPIVFRGPGNFLYGLKNTEPNVDGRTGPEVEVTAGKSLGLDEDGHHVLGLFPLPDGTLAVVRGERVLIWDPAKGERLATIDAKGEFRRFALTRDGRYLAGVGMHKDATFATVFDLRERKQLWTKTESRSRPHRVSTSFDGTKVYMTQTAATKDRVPGMIVYDTVTGKELERSNEAAGMVRIAFPDNSQMLIAHEAEHPEPAYLRLAEGSKWGTVIASLNRKLAAWFTTELAVSQSGKLIVWSSALRMLVMSSETCELRHDIKIATAPTGCVFSTDDRFFAWRYEGGGQESVYLLDMTTGKMVLRVTTRDPLKAACFSPDGAGLLVGIRDQVYWYELPTKK